MSALCTLQGSVMRDEDWRHYQPFLCVGDVVYPHIGEGKEMGVIYGISKVGTLNIRILAKGAGIVRLSTQYMYLCISILSALVMNAM